MKTRFTEFWKPSRIVRIFASSSRSKLPKVWRPPPVKKASAGLAAHDPEALEGGRLPQRAQKARHRVLGGRVEGAARGEIEAVEIVEGGHAQHRGEPGPHQVGALALHERHRRGGAPAPQLEPLGEG